MNLSISKQAGAVLGALLIFGGIPPISLALGERSPENSASDARYGVDGLALGAKIRFDSRAYREYHCSPSNQFPSFTWCTKSRADTEARGNFEVGFSILHTPDGTVVYVNRSQWPAYWSATEANDDIQRYSQQVGAQPRIIEMPAHPGLPNGTLAVWGAVVLEPLDQESLHELESGKSINRGLLIDFIGDFARSAREGLPVYRMTGGAGFVWVASYDETGKGTLRFCAVDASAYLRVNHGHQSASPAAIRKFDSPPQVSEGDDLPNEKIPALAYDQPDEKTLRTDQLFRDSLFKELKASTSQYTFDYVVINLPPGTLPGVKVTIPVAYVRYSDTVFFDFDQHTLRPSAESAVLDFARTMLKDKTSKSIVIVGHTNSIGSDEYNYTLSRKRAATVAMALRASGLSEKFLGIVPMGKMQPQATNSTPQGRALNRRVEFFISDIQGAPEAAIERIKYNPCYRNDDHTTSSAAACDNGHVVIPVLPESGEGRPVAVLDLSRSALPSNPHPFRDPLPNEQLHRPPIQELVNPN